MLTRCSHMITTLQRVQHRTVHWCTQTGEAADVQKSLDEVNNRIAGEKAQMDAIGQAQSKIAAQKAALGEEITAMEEKLAAAEQDRADKDEQIRTLKDEIEHQKH